MQHNEDNLFNMQVCYVRSHAILFCRGNNRLTRPTRANIFLDEVITLVVTSCVVYACAI